LRINVCRLVPQHGSLADHQASYRRAEVTSERVCGWDSKLPGFGVRVRPSGTMSYMVVYRASSGRGAPVRRFTIATVAKITPEAARKHAKAILGAVAYGHDPAGEKAAERGTPTVAGLADRFMSERVEPRRKPGTLTFYRHLLEQRPIRSRGRRLRDCMGSLKRHHSKPTGSWLSSAACTRLPGGAVEWRPSPGYGSCTDQTPYAIESRRWSVSLRIDSSSNNPS
jgi:hypothetical protein